MAVALHGDPDLTAALGLGQGVAQVVAVGDGIGAQLHDHVAGLRPAFAAGPSALTDVTSTPDLPDSLK